MSISVKSHFEGKDPIVRQTYDAILASMKKVGRVTEDPKKTSIHLVNVTAFAGIATRKSHIILTLKSDRALTSDRIHRSEKVSANRYHHELKISTSEDVNAELVKWLKEAYALSS
jgi:hypothetical protein